MPEFTDTSNQMLERAPLLDRPMSLDQPTPLDLPEFLPYACSQLQAPFALRLSVQLQGTPRPLPRSPFLHSLTRSPLTNISSYR